jgi:hypothetical protein
MKLVPVRITESCVIAPEGGVRFIAEVNKVYELSPEDALAVCGANRGVPVSALPNRLKESKDK